MSSREKTSLLGVLEQHYGDIESREGLGDYAPLTRLLLLILARGSKIKHATQVLQRLEAEYVDWNELRVTPTYELRKHLSGLDHGSPDAVVQKADQIRELLNMVFNRFNKLALDFLREGSTEPDAARKREKFTQWLKDHQPALEVMLDSYSSGKSDPAGHSMVQRVVQRIGWTHGKTGAIVTRSALQSHAEGLPPLALQWRLAQLASERCHARTPDCENCPVHGECALGKKTVKPSKSKTSKATGKPVAVARKTARK